MKPIMDYIFSHEVNRSFKHSYDTIIYDYSRFNKFYVQFCDYINGPLSFNNDIVLQ